MSNRKTNWAWRLSAAGFTLLPAVACISSSTTNPSTDAGSGSGSSSGDSGSATTDAASGNCAVPAGAVLVDDMETGMGSIIVSGGRQGAWYTYNDGTMTATQTPVPGTPFKHAALVPPRCSSHFAAETQGSDFAGYGAGMGFNFDDVPGADGGPATKATYDVSMYSGIGFWAKKASDLVSSSVTVSVTDDQTDPMGGICNPAGTTKATNGCNDAFALTFGNTPLPVLSPDWQWVSFKWSDLKQQNFGQAFPALDTKKVYALHFQFPTGVHFDFFVDDVYLLP